VVVRTAFLAAVLLVGATPSLAAAPPPGTLVFFSQRNPTGGLYAESAAGGRLRLLQTGPSDAGAFWSPDGKRYLFERAGNPVWTSELWIADADGRNRRRLAENAPQPNWAPSGRQIAFFRDGALWIVGANGSGAHRLTSPGTSTDGSPRWSPDGRRIAFLRSPGGPTSTLMTIRPNGTGLHAVADRVFFAPSWSPDGRRIAFDSSGPADTGAYEPRVYVADAGGQHLRRLVSSEVDGFVAWSPDGRRIAFGDAGTNSLSVAHPDGSDVRRLLGADYASVAAWAPDSRRLAVAVGNPADVWVVGVDGRARRVTQGWRYGYSSFNPSWQPRNLAPKRLGGKVVSPPLPSDSIVAAGVLESTRAVTSLAADGSRVAIQYAVGQPIGGLIETWDARSRRIVRFNDGGLDGPTLADDRIAVWSFEHALGTNSYGISTATVERPNPAWVGGLCPPQTIGFCIRDPLGDVVGHGSLIAFDSWKGPEPYCNLPCPPPKRDGRLYRLDNGNAVQIAASPHELTPLSVDGEQILVDEGSGTLAVFDAMGSRTMSVDVGDHTAAKLQGRDLVVQNGLGLEDYDAETGTLLHSWPAPTDASLDDVHNGTAVYVTAAEVHLLRLADGRDLAIHPPGHGPLHAQLEGPGLFYSYNVDDGARPGRVAFVPSTALP